MDSQSKFFGTQTALSKGFENGLALQSLELEMGLLTLIYNINKVDEGTSFGARGHVTLPL